MSGIISVPIILVYIFICYLIYKLLIQDVESKTLAKVIFTLILTFPFWDLIVQKGIKTVYQVSGLLEPKIYAYPEKDDNGMIESLSLGDRTSQWYYEEIQNGTIGKFIISRYGKLLKEKIKYLDYIFFVEGKNKIFRFYLEENQLKYKILEKEQSRYKFVMDLPKQNNWWKLFGISTEKVIDNKLGKNIAEAYGIGFEDIPLFEYIRRDIFFLRTGVGGSIFYISSYVTRGEMWQKVIVKGK